MLVRYRHGLIIGYALFFSFLILIFLCCYSNIYYRTGFFIALWRNLKFFKTFETFFITEQSNG